MACFRSARTECAGGLEMLVLYRHTSFGNENSSTFQPYSSGFDVLPVTSSATPCRNIMPQQPLGNCETSSPTTALASFPPYIAEEKLAPQSVFSPTRPVRGDTYNPGM